MNTPMERARTVLIVDDSPEDITVLREALKSEHRILAASDQATAMRVARADPPPDLILLDVTMPELDGYALCRAIKADVRTKAIPVIFVTSKDSAENEAAGFSAGAVDYIAKPANPPLVRARVATHISLKLAREALEKQNDVLRENVRLRQETEAINRHDLKTPLMIVMNVPRMILAEGGLSEHSQKLLRMADEAARAMLEMVNRTIDTYKMETGTYDLKAVPVDVLPVIDRIQLALKEMVDSRRIVCSLSAEQVGPTFLVLAEELLLYSLLANLIRNAVEATPAGGHVTIAVRNEGQATIEIHNPGVIPESIRGSFFQRGATAGKKGGTGLGAYSAMLATKTLGGSIDFVTGESSGTTITVRLPMPSAAVPQ